MGTMIQRHKLTEEDFRGARFSDHAKDLRGNNDLLILTRPDIISEIHGQYLAAGADIIETNTFSSTTVAQADYLLESVAYELNLEGARLARAACDEWTTKTPDRPRLVAGSIGPTNRTLSISPEVNNPAFRAITFDELRVAYEEQVRGLIDGGSDLILLETIFDTLNAKAGIVAIENVFAEKGVRLPLMISFTITDKSGRTLSGQTLEAFYASVRHARPFSIGINCALGARDMRPYLADLARIAECYVSSYPNAGLPNAFGAYDELPAETGELVKDFAASGFVNIVGGCCGTTPDHIRSIAEAVAGLPPRRVKPPASASASAIGHRPSDIAGEPHFTELSGLEPLVIRPDSNFQMIGERTNVTGSARFARLVKADNWADAAQVALDQVRGGANIIDVNMDEGMLDSERAMTTFLNYIATEPEVARVPVMVDSSKWSVLEAGLKCIQGKGVVNSISLKEGEEDFLKKARTIHHYGAAVIVMAFDETGQADTIERKVSICQRAYRLLTEEADYDPSDIIFDPNILAIATGLEEHNDYAVNYIEAARHHQGHVPGRQDQRRRQQPLLLVPRQRRRPRGHALGVPLPRHQGRHGHGHRQRRPAGRLRGHPRGSARARRGRDLQPPARRDRPARPVRRDGEGDGQGAAGGSRLAQRHGGRAAGVRARPRQRRVHRAGYRGGAAEVPAAARHHRGSADGRHEDRRRPVRRGQDVPAAGRQVRPRDEEGGRLSRAVHGEREGRAAGQGSQRGDGAGAHRHGDGEGGRPRHRQEHRRRRARLQQLRSDRPRRDGAGGEDPRHGDREEGGPRRPERPDHAVARRDGDGRARDGAPAHDAAAAHRRRDDEPSAHGGEGRPGVSASPSSTSSTPRASSTSCRSCSTPSARARSCAATSRRRRRSASATRRAAEKPLLTYEQARANKLVYDWDDHVTATPAFVGRRFLDDVPLEEIARYIDWTYFFSAWELKGKFPAILDHPQYGEAARQLYEDAQALLKKIVGGKLIRARGVHAFWPAAADGDDIVVYKDEDRHEVLARLPMLRQQELQPDDRPNLSLADYIAPKGSGIPDYLGMFAVTGGIGAEELAKRYEADHDDYRAIMVKALADRLAEAFATYLHARVRDDWGHPDPAAIAPDDLHHEKHRGIRPAPGYPACPDHSGKFDLFKLLQAERQGMALTEHAAMTPAATVSGFYFSHPQAKYFNVGRIGRDQVESYATRKGLPLEEVEKWLSPNLSYEPLAAGMKC